MALACLAMLLCGASFDIPSDSWVMDDANILSAQTEQYVNERTKVLSDACGAQIGVATVERPFSSRPPAPVKLQPATSSPTARWRS